MLTYIIYFGLLLCCYWGAKQAERLDKIKYLLVVAVLLTFVSGFRSESVGIDTISYINKFNTIADGYPEYAYGLEEGFKIICILLLKLCNSNTFIFVIIAGLTNFFILIRFWDFKDIASVPCMVLCYYTQFFFMTMNVMRQFLAIAILFYYSRCLAKRKYVQFSIIVLLVSSFIHRSALVGILFLVLELLQWKNISRNQKLILCCGVWISPIILIYIVSRIEKYSHYFQNIDLNLGIMIPTKILFICFIMLLQNNFKLHIGKNRNSEYINYRVLAIKTYYIAGLIISMAGYCFSFMDRIGWYFYIFEGCCLGNVIAQKNRKYRQLIIVGSIILLGYSFLNAIVSKSQGVVPFHFVWCD